MVIITVQLSQKLARALRRQIPPTSELTVLLGAVEELQITLKPLHPGAYDVLLVPWYTITLEDPTRAEHVITRLLRCKGVEAAYVTPPTELP
jgi:hypothetical protein